MKNPTKLPDLSLIEANFFYDPDLGILYRKSGSPVFNNDRTGTRKIRVGRKSTTVARICWALFHRKDPGSKHIVKHINEDPFDNRIKNLRLVRIH